MFNGSFFFNKWVVCFYMTVITLPLFRGWIKLDPGFLCSGTNWSDILQDNGCSTNTSWDWVIIRQPQSESQHMCISASLKNHLNATSNWFLQHFTQNPAMNPWISLYFPWTPEMAAILSAFFFYLLKIMADDLEAAAVNFLAKRKTRSPQSSVSPQSPSNSSLEYDK